MRSKKITNVFLISVCFIFFSISTVTAESDRAFKKRYKKSSGNYKSALIIGNSNYRVSPLKNPANDATDFANTLRSVDFDVVLLVDADRREMGQAIRSFGKRLMTKKGIGLFFFAGHGMQVEGRNYLIPVNSNIQSEDEVEYNAIDAGRVLRKMEAANNPMNMVFLDACRNNPFARSFRSGNQGLAEMDAPTGSLIVYATAAGSVAADGSGRNGIFTKHLLDNMLTPGQDVIIMLRRVRQGVLDETDGKQTPWNSSSLTGSFSFVGGTAPPPVAPQPRKKRPTLNGDTIEGRLKKAIEGW